MSLPCRSAHDGGGPERAAALLKWQAARIISRGRGASDDKRGPDDKRNPDYTRGTEDKRV